MAVPPTELHRSSGGSPRGWSVLEIEQVGSDRDGAPTEVVTIDSVEITEG